MRLYVYTNFMYLYTHKHFYFLYFRSREKVTIQLIDTYKESKICKILKKSQKKRERKLQSF